MHHPDEHARERAWLASCRRRARHYGVPFEPVTRAAIYARGGGVCYLCQRRIPIAAMQGEHVVPLSRGGWNVAANLRCACGPCNIAKGARRPLDAPHPWLLASLSHVLARLGVPARLADIVPSPAVWTTLWAADPLLIPRVTDRDREISTAAGSTALLRVFRAGHLLAIQVPRERPRVVPLRNMDARGRRVQIGVPVSGGLLSLDLAHPLSAHAFIAGANGSGKSVLLRAIVAPLAKANAPDRLRLLLADTKRQTFVGPLARLPHSPFAPARTPAECQALVRFTVGELQRRISATPDGEPWRPDAPPWLLVLDELHDAGGPELLLPLVRQGREFGMHVVAATQVQRATEVDTRVAGQFGVGFCGVVHPADVWTSRQVLGTDDARHLVHPGDFFMRRGRQLVRFSAAWASPQDPYWGQGFGVADLVSVPAGGTTGKRAGPEPVPAEARAWILEHVAEHGKPPAVRPVAARFGMGKTQAARWIKEATAT